MRLLLRRCGWHPLGYQRLPAQEPDPRCRPMIRLAVVAWPTHRSMLRLGHPSHSAASPPDCPCLAAWGRPRRRWGPDRFAWSLAPLVENPGRQITAAAANLRAGPADLLAEHRRASAHQVGSSDRRLARFLVALAHLSCTYSPAFSRSCSDQPLSSLGTLPACSASLLSMQRADPPTTSAYSAL